MDEINKKNYKNLIPEISFCRVIAMLFIVFAHWCTFYNYHPFNIIFAVGVNMFLFISGFLLSKCQIEDWYKWSIKRAKRLLIPYYLVFFIILISYLLIGESVSYFEFFVYLFNLQGLDHIFPFKLPDIVGFEQTWYITVLLICYLIFYILKENNFEVIVINNPRKIMFFSIIFQILCAYCGIGIGVFINFFISLGNKVDIACNEKAYSLPLCFREWGCKVYNIDCNRSPFVFSNIIAINQIKNIVLNSDYDIVHCHTPIAAACTRIACKLVNKNIRVIYTAHGFHFYKGAPLLNWLIYFPIEWFLSFITDTLITINKEDYEFAKNHLHAKRTEYIPGVGINIEKFANVKVDIKAKRKELGIPENCKLILSVGELNKNKNHQVVLKALAELKDPNIHYAICGQGILHDYLLNLAKKLNISEKFHLLGSRKDVAEILKCADIFIHPSLREGLPVALMEALASGLPCIASKIRGNIDLIQDNVNGFIAEDYSPTTYVQLIKKQICKNCGEKALNQEYSYMFGIDNIIGLIGSLYE